MEGNLCFKIDWVSLIVGSKFTVFALFYFLFGGAYIWRGDLTALGFLHYWTGGAYIWKRFFSEFYGTLLFI